MGGAKAALAAAVLLTLVPTSAPAADDSLTTVAERSKFRSTGRYPEVLQLCAAFEKAYPRSVRCTTFGRTPEGRPMVALIASRSGALLPDDVRRRKLPVVLIQGGIHAGEIDGKDAGFIALREMLEGRAAQGALEKTVLIFVPVFNVDGHERFGRWNRPNQRGPEEMGWRTTAQNFNLNRDYVKSDSPEMQAMLRMIDTWDPLATIDLHVTDGRSSSDIAILVEPCTRATGAAQSRRDLRDGVIDDLEAGSSPWLLSLVRRRTIAPPASWTTWPRRASRTATCTCATASDCWWRRTRGRIIRRACERREIRSFP